jgi:pimeloyl-ACP methyl ester carboxylesterase
MRAREPDGERYVDLDGVKLHYEVFGDGACEAEGRAALAVLDAAGAARAVLVSLSMGAQWALWLTAHHPGRVLGNVFIGPDLDLESWPEDVIPPFDEPFTSTEGWARHNRHYWLAHYRDFVEFFVSRCLPEPHSTKQHEDNVGWGLETTPQVLLATEAASQPDEATIRRWCARVRSPVLVVHGDKDRICPLTSGEALARATGGSLVVLGGAGHLPHARDPVKVNLLIREFAAYLPARGAP